MSPQGIPGSSGAPGEKGIAGEPVSEIRTKLNLKDPSVSLIYFTFIH